MLERRHEHLRRRVKEENRRQASKDFDLAELGALEDAIRALRRYNAEWQLGTDAVVLLRRLREAFEKLEMCATCDGSGIVNGDACRPCGGTGFSAELELLETVDALLEEVGT